MKVITRVNLFLSVLLSLFISSCATESFNKKIETSDVDLLKEESLMRYNTNRLEQLQNNNKDFIASALLACHENKFLKGLNILEDEMHSHKKNAFYWNAVGTCYYLKKDFSKAQFYYDLGIEAIGLIRTPESKLAEATLLNNTGLIHLNFKRFNEAFEAFKKSSNLMPQFMTPQFNMAQLYIEFNQNDKALDILKKCETQNPNDIDLLYTLSLVYFRKNDLKNSYSTISRIKKDYLNRPDIVGLYAYNLMKINRLPEAKEIIEKRLYADEYNSRNKILLEEINQKIKELSKQEKK